MMKIRLRRAAAVVGRTMRSDYAYLPFLLIAIVLIEFLPKQVLRGAHTVGLRLYLIL